MRDSVGIHGYVMVFSVASRPSFEMIKVLNDKILALAGTKGVPRVLVCTSSLLPLQVFAVVNPPGRCSGGQQNRSAHGPCGDKRGRTKSS